MNLAVTLFLVLTISLVGTLIATALFSMVDSDEAPDAITGDDYPNAREAADR